MTEINKGDVITHGDVTALAGVKIFVNFVVPLIVSNLGVLAGDRSARG